MPYLDLHFLELIQSNDSKIKLYSKNLINYIYE